MLVAEGASTHPHRIALSFSFHQVHPRWESEDPRIAASPWVDYGTANTSALEEAFFNGADSITITVNGMKFVVNFKVTPQINDGCNKRDS